MQYTVRRVLLMTWLQLGISNFVSEEKFNGMSNQCLTSVNTSLYTDNWQLVLSLQYLPLANQSLQWQPTATVSNPVFNSNLLKSPNNPSLSTKVYALKKELRQGRREVSVLIVYNDISSIKRKEVLVPVTYTKLQLVEKKSPVSEKAK